MSAVDHDHFHATQSGHLRRIGKALHNVVDGVLV